LSPSKGSGIRSAASRSATTSPGTVAGIGVVPTALQSAGTPVSGETCQATPAEESAVSNEVRRRPAGIEEVTEVQIT
jgi:hypothetical protein